MTVAGLTSDLPTALAVLLALIVVIAAGAAAVLLVLARRGGRREGHEIVRAIEEMRSGRPRTRLDIEPRSPFAPIADSVNRLGQDLSVRWMRTEAAGEAFHALQDAARGYGVIATDADGDVRTFSPGAAQLFGWDEDDVLGRNVSLLFDEGSFKEVLPKLARKSLRERGIESRALMLRKDGARFAARLAIRLLKGQGDDHPGFLLVIQDVSEQVRAESGERAAEQRSRQILDALPGSVALVQDGGVVYANAGARALLEIDEREAGGLALRERIATADVLLVQDTLAGLESGEGARIFEGSVRLRDASGRDGSTARMLATLHAHDGRPAVLVMLRDDTAPRREQAQLAAQEARLVAILEAWDEGLLLVEDGPAGARVRVVNRAFIAAFGLPPSLLPGATEGEALRALRERGEDGAAAAGCLAAAGSSPAQDVVETGGRTLSLAARPIGDEGAPLRGRLLVVRDVTAESARNRERGRDAEGWRRRFEAEEAAHAKLRLLHDELAGKRADAERLNQELRTLDTMKSDLLANVSHELQTPLVSIRGYTEMILKGRLGSINDEQKQGLALSLRNIDRLIAMIDNLLAFARMDREAGALKIQSFPLAGVVDEAVALLREKIDARGVRVEQRAADRGLTVRADRDKIVQVFVNLLSNAVKFNRDHGTIEIDLGRGKPGFALVHVRDTGVGIAKDDLEKIFDRFYQAGDRAGEAGKDGTGIGLAIVRNILRAHGCVIHAASAPGEGTTFTFTLPLAHQKAVTQETEPAAPSTPPPPPRDEPPAQNAPDRPRLRIIRRA